MNSIQEKLNDFVLQSALSAKKEEAEKVLHHAFLQHEKSPLSFRFSQFLERILPLIKSTGAEKVKEELGNYFLKSTKQGAKNLSTNPFAVKGGKQPAYIRQVAKAKTKRKAPK